MANGDQQGILGMLGMQNQQPQGLLGALGDPETMAYIAMMLKGISPYSQIDPNSMLSNAHTMAMRKQALMQQQAEQARDNARADERLGFDRQRFSQTTQEHAAKQAEHESVLAERKRLAELDRKAAEMLGQPSEIPTQARPTEGSTESSYDTEDRTAAGIGLVPREEPTEASPTESVASEPASRRVQLEQKLENLNQMWQSAGTDKMRSAVKMEIDRTEKQLGMSPSETRMYSEAKEGKASLEMAKASADRAAELLKNPNLYEGFRATASGWAGNLLGGSNMTQDARETAELKSRMSAEALQELSKFLKPLSEKEGKLILELQNRPGMPLSEKKIRVEALQKAIDERYQNAKDTIHDLEERERPGTSARRRPASPAPASNVTQDALKKKYGLE